MEKNRTTVRIAGQEFKLTSSDSPEYVNTVASYADNKIKETQMAYPGLSSSNCVLLAMLNLSDELHKLRRDYEALDSRISQLREMPRTAGTPVKRPFENKQVVKKD